MDNYMQPFIEGFLKAEAKARESLITNTERDLHLAKQALRFEKMQKKIGKNNTLYQVLERHKKAVFQLMER